MKKLVTFCLSLFVCFSATHAQTTIYSQNFNSGSASDWTLNTTDLGGVNNAPSGNGWYINNVYTAGIAGTPTATEPAGIVGGPSSYYMHINCGSSLAPAFGSNDNFNADGSGETYFASLNAASAISTVGYTNVYLSFWWLCNGSSDSKGNVYYRTSASGAWIEITSPISDFFGSSTWANDSFHLAAFDGQAYLQFGFQFTNGFSGSGSDPAFGIDDISVTGNGGTVTAPVANFESAGSTACQDSCISFTNSSTGTIDSVRWSTTPGSSTIASPTSTSSTNICFLAPGAYSVSITAYNSGGSNTHTAVINVTPTPHPAITQVGAVLSVPAAYTTYQWYNGLSAITGATTNTYTITATSTYGIVVDSAGCIGGDTLTTGPLHVTNLNNLAGHYWVAQTNSSSIIVNSSKPIDDALSITLYDATGRKVLDDVWEAGSYSRQINGLSVANGLYIIKLSNSYTSTVLKWQKQ